MPALEDQQDRLMAAVPNLRRYARALIGNRSRADDLVRDTLEYACSRTATRPCPQDIRPCLLGIMHQRYFAGGGREVSGGSPVRTSEASPVDAALQALPDEQRAILLLIVLERMTCEEVASVIGWSVASVIGSLSLGRDKLRTQLDTAARASLP
ncbi:sigma factor-like helix-turn-helix DNA-binding protein [Azoarcus sp. KH32C]|uniref:sigma factor-like helix-turn-helix DNA-binding protein n=1 Tax=Azoarcus sp. KH32C TaxID=748247 RepID=UPI0002386BA6|nr:sigma factor-like helix-turn-helix DNA-binding protein [Azoarcus sp. KH32C]BAL25438.1 ECF subfamily RNA polymerase, sigma-24 subunit [Azoarcus sp. KH32C]